MEFSRRRIIPALLGASALPLTPQLSLADQRFVSYAFPATGAPTPRTMPDRLADIKNVLDFGADPTGNGGTATATTAAIQAAVNAAFAAGGGIVFFPPGTYAINAAVTFNNNTAGVGIAFVGTTGAQIQGNFNGFLLDRNNVNAGAPEYSSSKWVFEKLTFVNPNTGSSAGCIRLGSCSGASITDCQFQGQKCVTSEDSPGNSSKNILFENCKFTGPNAAPYLANGVILGGPSTLLGCDFVGLDVGGRIYGNGFFATGCRAENCNVGYLFGLDSAGTDQGASGFSLASSCEGDGIGIHLAGTCSGFFITGGQLGHDIGNTGYPLGVAPATTYGILVGANCSNGLFLNCNPNNFATVAGISIATASSRANLVFRGTTSITIGGAQWQLPTNAFTAFFEGCNISPVWTFSQLPSGANVLEGDEFNISDGTNGLTWGQTATNTGTHTTHYLVRWNGTNWTVVGV